VIEWGAALGELYKNRDVLASTAKAGWNRLFGVDGRAAFVGPGGSGKTVLFDHILSQVDDSYEVPGKSMASESGKFKAFGIKSGLIVAPGQGASRRLTYDKVFDKKNGVNVVVFFGTYGYLEFREELSHEIAELTTPDEASIRAKGLAREVDELDEIVHRFAQSNLATNRASAVLMLAINVDRISMTASLMTMDYYSSAAENELLR
jgi:hypothetical protein